MTESEYTAPTVAAIEVTSTGQEYPHEGGNSNQEVLDESEVPVFGAPLFISEVGGQRAEKPDAKYREHPNVSAIKPVGRCVKYDGESPHRCHNNR